MAKYDLTYSITHEDRYRKRVNTKRDPKIMQLSQGAVLAPVPSWLSLTPLTESPNQHTVPGVNIWIATPNISGIIVDLSAINTSLHLVTCCY